MQSDGIGIDKKQVDTPFNQIPSSWVQCTGVPRDDDMAKPSLKGRDLMTEDRAAALSTNETCRLVYIVATHYDLDRVGP